MDISSIDAYMLDAVVRLARLLDTPDEIQALAPLIIREIVYRLLKGEQGARLNHLLASGADKKLFGAPPQRDIARLRSNLEL